LTRFFASLFYTTFENRGDKSWRDVVLQLVGT